MKSLIYIALIYLILLAKLGNVESCTCLPQTPLENFNNAFVIFSGKVTDKVAEGDMNYKVTFGSVVLRYKTSGSQQCGGKIIVRTAMSSAACGFNFEVGQNYLVYADKSNDLLIVSLCSRTQLLNENSCDDLEFLTKLRNK